MEHTQIVEGLRSQDADTAREALEHLFPGIPAMLLVNQEQSDKVVTTAGANPPRMFGLLLVMAVSIARSMGLDLNWVQTEPPKDKIQIVGSNPMR